MRHLASPAVWETYESLPVEVRKLADQAYARLKEDPRHLSLRFEKVGRVWSVRIGLRYRALAVEADDGLVWFWIGAHADDDKLLDEGLDTGRRPCLVTRRGPHRRSGPRP